MAVKFHYKKDFGVQKSTANSPKKHETLYWLTVRLYPASKINTKSTVDLSFFTSCARPKLTTNDQSPIPNDSFSAIITDNQEWHIH